MNKEIVYKELSNILNKEYEKDYLAEMEIRKMPGAIDGSGLFRSIIKKDVPLKDYTSFKVGGPADIIVDPGNEVRLYSVLRYLKKEGIPYIVLGNGSNIIFRDGGYRGVILLMSSEIAGSPMFGGLGCEKSGNRYIVTADAGMLLSTLAKLVANEYALSGMEPLSGIPGTLGGAVFMNAGAYGGEIKDIIKSVTAYDPETDKVETITKEEMDLSYRHSVFQKNGKIIIDVTFELEQGDEDEILNTMRELTKKRNAKQPVNLPSAGSFFKRPEGHYAGKLIEDAGLKGLKKGGAQISELHSGFMVNAGGATCRDIEDLMQVVRTAVYDKFGVELEPEVRIEGEY